jgi:manganese transport protein
MDPGNWGTDLQAGSKYGHQLLWVLLLSNLMALLLQTLATRLGVVTGRDLAQSCREIYPTRTVAGLWLLTEVAIAATDLAEVIGTIIALKLLFNLPYLLGLVVAAADTFLLLALQRRGVRLLEVITLLLVAVIAGSFVFEIVLARPDWAAVVRGFMPGLAANDLGGSLYVAIAILGATVMPHNLYLHSALVQTRAFPRDPEGKALACRYNLFDSLVALNGAFFINAAILVMAATTFTEEVSTFQQAYRLLDKVWGKELAHVLFAIALLASGQSSTFTGTLAGQVVMEGFVRLRVRPWVRRLATRSLALLPALLVLALTTGRGNGEEADEGLLQMLVLSQAVLGFQLPFAIIPLVQLTSDRQHMGAFASRTWLKGLAWLCAAFVVVLNAALIVASMNEWAGNLGSGGWVIYATIAPLSLVLAGFLGWVTLYPYLVRRRAVLQPGPILPALPAVHYGRIGVAVEFTPADESVLAHATALARQHRAPLLLLHVVEGTGADIHGPQTDDQESRLDRLAMAQLVGHLREANLDAEGILGYGVPAQELVRLAEEQKLTLLVLGMHGHRFLADLALGETVSPVLHRLAIPILVVPPIPVSPKRQPEPRPRGSGDQSRAREEAGKERKTPLTPNPSPRAGEGGKRG